MPNSRVFHDDSGRLRTIWRLAVFLVGLVLVSVAVAIVLFVVLIMYAGIRGGDLGALGDGASWDGQLLIAIATVPLAVAASVWVWVCRRFLDRRSLTSLGLPRRWCAPFCFGLLVGTFPIALSVAILAALGKVHPAGGTNGSVLTVVLVPMMLVAAFQEELICRGYVLRNFLDIGRPVSGIAVSSVLFAGFHLLNPHVWSGVVGPLNLVLAGVLLALAYLVSGDLWFPWGMHFGWNVCQGVVFGLPVSGMPVEGWIRFEPASQVDVVSGGAFGLEGSVVITFLLLALSALFVLVILRGKGVR